jgi:hypothetical protein
MYQFTYLKFDEIWNFPEIICWFNPPGFVPCSSGERNGKELRELYQERLYWKVTVEFKARGGKHVLDSPPPPHPFQAPLWHLCPHRMRGRWGGELIFKRTEEEPFLRVGHHGRE